MALPDLTDVQTLFTKQKDLYKLLASFNSRAFLVWIVTSSLLIHDWINATEFGTRFWYGCAMVVLSSVYFVAQKWEDSTEARAKADIAIAALENPPAPPPI